MTRATLMNPAPVRRAGPPAWAGLVLTRVLLVLVFLALWVFAASRMPTFVLPGPAKVWNALVALTRTPSFLHDVGMTTYRVAAGFLLALHFATWISSLEYTSVASSTALVTTNPLWIGLAYGFSASWYYIAAERPRALAGIDLSCSLTSFALILALVRGPADALLALWLFVIPLLAAALYGHLLARRRYGFRLTSPVALLASLALSLRFFFFTGFPSLTNRWSVVALAIWSDPLQVVYFAAGEKLTTAAINTTVPLTRVLLPRIGRLMAGDPGAAYRDIRRYVIGIGGFYLCASAVTIALAGIIYPIMFGANLAEGSRIFAAQMLMVPFAASSRVLVQVGLTSLRKEGFCALVFIASTLLYLLVSALIAPTGGGIGIALARAAIEMIVLLLFVRAFIQAGHGRVRP